MKTRIAITILLVVSFFFLPKYAYTSSLGIEHFLYPISHANIVHLLVNILCLWMVRCPVNILVTYTVAVIASYLPAVSLYGLQEIPTMGFSGILFAMVGITWGRVQRFKDMFIKNKWYLIIPFFIPNINAFVHIYCLLLGFAYGYYSVYFSQSVWNRR